MNFRFIDRYDHEIVPINNAPASGGNGYGDAFSDRDLLAESNYDYIGFSPPFFDPVRRVQGYGLEVFEFTQGEAAGRGNFQKVALYHGSKASRKILGPPLQSWPSWSAVPQSRPQSVVIHARPATANTDPPQFAAEYFRQAIPPAITATLCDTGSDLVYAGNWSNHQDTRTADNVTRTLTTSGYVWLSVAPHFSPTVMRDEQTLQLRHDWKNRAIFYLTFVLFYKENPAVILQNPFSASSGGAGVRFRQFAIRAKTSLPVTLALPETGLYAPAAAEDSYEQTAWSDIPYASTFEKNYTTGAVYQTNWVRSSFPFYILGQSFYIAPT